jgi:hypothetical protein
VGGALAKKGRQRFLFVVVVVVLNRSLFWAISTQATFT